MLIVTGATGQFGRIAVEALLRRVPAERVGVSVREPEKAAALAARGVRVRRGDFADPSSLAGAFEGAERVLIVSVDKLGEEAITQHRAAIGAAVAAGAGQILYTGLIDLEKSSRFVPTATHLAAEAELVASGVPFTALRNGFYAESMIWLIGDGLKSGVVSTPADGPVTWTARADLAEAAAVILAEGSHRDEYVPLTGSVSVDLAGLAGIASEVAGRSIRREVISEDDQVAAMLAKGLPEVMARMTLGLFAASREGQFTRIDPTLARILGREPRSPREVLEAAVRQDPA